MKTTFLLSLLCLVFLPHIYAQSPTVRGTVKDRKGNGLIDASVENKKSMKSVHGENEDGKYTIEAQKGDVLVFSCHAFLSKTLVVNSATHNVVLDIDPAYVHEPFVRPYRKVQAIASDGAVSVAQESVPISEPIIAPVPESVTEPLNTPIMCIVSNEPEYDVVVMEPGYDTFLITQQPIDFYSVSTLKTKNTFLVNEWNLRCDNPQQYDAGIYEMRIDYNPQTNYGLDVEYKLYMFFRFMNKKYHLKLDVH